MNCKINMILITIVGSLTNVMHAEDQIPVLGATILPIPVQQQASTDQKQSTDQKTSGDQKSGTGGTGGSGGGGSLGGGVGTGGSGGGTTGGGGLGTGGGGFTPNIIAVGQQPPPSIQQPAPGQQPPTQQLPVQQPPVVQPVSEQPKQEQKKEEKPPVAQPKPEQPAQIPAQASADKAAEEKAQQERALAEQKAREESLKQAEEIAQKQKKAEEAHVIISKQLAEEEAKHKEEWADVGIDTLNMEDAQGDWVLKRIALEHTVDTIELINGLFKQILETRMDFLVKRNKVNHDLDQFAVGLGFELGEIDQVLEELLKDFETIRKTEGDLTANERDLLQQVEQKKHLLKQLQDGFKSLVELEDVLEKVVMQLEQEIDKSNNYQGQAWNNFQKIKETLNDEKAEELRAQTESLYKNMQNSINYLKNDLLPHFDGIIKDITSQIIKIKSDVDALKAQGLDLEKVIEATMQKLRAADKERMKEEITQEVEKQIGQPAEQKEKQLPQPNGWLYYVLKPWYYVRDMFTSFWNYIKSFF